MSADIAIAPIDVLPEVSWTSVCPLDAVLADGGVAALLDGTQIAIFRLRSGEVYAIANHDPCGGANVLARGIVGDAQGRPYVASPLHKQRFDLATGVCMDAEDVRVETYPTRVVDGVVQVAAPRHGG